MGSNGLGVIFTKEERLLVKPESSIVCSWFGSSNSLCRYNTDSPLIGFSTHHSPLPPLPFS